MQASGAAMVSSGFINEDDKIWLSKQSGILTKHDKNRHFLTPPVYGLRPLWQPIFPVFAIKRKMVLINFSFFFKIV
jgi:hypothetical protein